MKKPRRTLLEAMSKDHANGMSYRDIARKYGRTKGSVEWWIKRRFRPRKLTDWKRKMAERNDRIVTLAMRGVDLKRVARAVGSNYQTVWKIARRYGVRRSTEVKRDRAREWRRRNDAGESMAAIARSDGVPATTVRAAILRLNMQEVASE